MAINGTRLLITNLLFMLLVWLAGYYPGLDLAGSAGFFIFTLYESRRLHSTGMTAGRRAITACIAQLPGVILEPPAIVTWFIHAPAVSDYDFALSIWHTSWNGILSLLPQATVGDVYLPYLLLYLLTPLYIGLMTGWPVFSDAAIRWIKKMRETSELKG